MVPVDAGGSGPRALSAVVDGAASVAPFDAVETTRALVRALKDELAEDERVLLLCRDIGFKAAAEQLGVGLSTAHERFHRLVARVKPIAEALHAGPDELELAVQLLRDEQH